MITLSDGQRRHLRTLRDAPLNLCEVGGILVGWADEEPCTPANQRNSCCHAVVRGCGIGWHVFGRRAYSIYMVVLLMDWCYCMARIMLWKRVKDIPRRELVRDIAGICTGDLHKRLPGLPHLRPAMPCAMTADVCA